MSEWFGALPALGASVLLLLLPGLLTGLALRLRGLWLWATAPGISLAAFAGASVVLPALDLPWNPVAAALLALALCALLVLLIRGVLRSSLAVIEPEAEAPRHRRAWTLGTLTVSAAILLSTAVAGIRSADAVSQTLDNLFHLGAVRYIIDTGNASPLWVGTFAAPGSTSSFYPDLWHAAVALVSQLAGVELPVAVNVFNLTVMIVVWPAGVLLLVRQLSPASPAATAAAGVLAASFPAFPLNLLTYGVLYPYFLALALLPLALALLLQALGLSREARFQLRRAVIAVGATVGAAIGFSHPSAFMTLLAFSVPIALVAYLRGWRTRRPWLRLVSTALLLGYLASGAVLFQRVRTSFQWPAQTGLDTALTQTITGNYLGAGFGFLVGALALTGAVVAVVRRDACGIAVAGVWLVGATLYASAAGAEAPLLRRLVSAWYADTPRLGAAAVISIIPVAALGFAWLCERLARVPRAGLTLSAIIGTGVLLTVVTTAGYPGFLQQMRISYDPRSDEYIDDIPPVDRALLGNLAPNGDRVALNNVLSSDERDLIERLPEHVPHDATIIGSPWTGTTLAYALAERPVVPPYLTTTVTPDEALILQDFGSAPDDPAVCDALDETGVRFILDFGEREVHSGDSSYPGIENLDGNPAVELVDRQGEAQLFRITSCGLGG